MDDSPAATLPSAISARPRSVFVTVAGLVLACLPWALLAGLFAFSAHPPRWPGGALADAVPGLAIVLGWLAWWTATGLAMVRRWYGWRFYAGALAWFLILVALMLPQNDMGPFDSGGPRFVWLAACLGLMGVFILVAKRDEPPAKPFSHVTSVGVFLIVIAAGLMIGAVITALSLPNANAAAAVPGSILAALLAGCGSAMVHRWRGWRIYAGTLGWIFIVMAVFRALNLLIQLSEYRVSLGRAFMEFEVTLMAGAFGYWILWAKRQEPRPILSAA